MKRIKLEHIERLSKGKRSGLNIGSRSIGHHLRPHERECYQRALKKGYLDIYDRDRDNLWHIWEKACLAQGIDFLVLLKLTGEDIGTVYRNNSQLTQTTLHGAKQVIKSLVRV